jgi:hypothetical protein
MIGLQAFLRWVSRSGKRIAITVVGVVLVLVGLAGIVLPILPGPLVIIAGLAVLGTEYAWARRALEEAKRRAARARDRVRRRQPGDRPSRPWPPPGPSDPSDL